MTQLAKTDKDYASWIEELSQRYRKSQIKAATHVNSEMLQFYWSLGRDIVTLHAKSVGEMRYTKRRYMPYNEYFTNSPPSWG